MKTRRSERPSDSEKEFIQQVLRRRFHQEVKPEALEMAARKLADAVPAREREAA